MAKFQSNFISRTTGPHRRLEGRENPRDLPGSSASIRRYQKKNQTRYSFRQAIKRTDRTAHIRKPKLRNVLQPKTEEQEDTAVPG